MNSWKISELTIIDHSYLVAALMATNRQTLIEWAEGFIRANGEPLIKVVAACGSIREWSTKSFVPHKSVECRCGDLDYQHYFLKYEAGVEH